MRRLARRPLTPLVPALVTFALLALPGAALAAGPVTVIGTVVRDGAPVVAVEVVVTVTGTDIAATTATDEQGAFALELEAAVGDELQVFATGQTSRSGPDGAGCVRTETPIGEATSVIESIPPAPVEVDLDDVLRSTVCTATGTPGVTPPSTDGGMAPRDTGGAGTGLLLVVGVLALVGAAGLARARRS